MERSCIQGEVARHSYCMAARSAHRTRPRRTETMTPPFVKLITPPALFIARPARAEGSACMIAGARSCSAGQDDLTAAKPRMRCSG